MDNKNEYHKYKEYDYYKLKNIIKENLVDIKKNSLFNKEKYDCLLNENDLDIDTYLNQNKNKINESLESEGKDKNLLKESRGVNIEEINQLEMNAIHKAKELENQIKFINSKRIDYIVKEFREKLIEDSQTEFKNFLDILHDEYKSALTKINDDHSQKLNSIYKLQNKIEELQSTLKVISQDLKDEKIELTSTFEKYLTHMEKEMNNSIEKYKSDMNSFIDNRVRIFRKHLESNK